MFYNKPLLTKRVSDYKVKFSAFANGMNTDIDEGILPYKYAKSCYNYEIVSGALKDGIGFEALKLPESRNDVDTQRLITMEPNKTIKALWLYKYYDPVRERPDYRLLFYTDDGVIRWTQLYTLYPYTFAIASFIYSSGVPNAVNYRLNGTDYMIFSSNTDGMWKYASGVVAQTITNGPSIVSMCLHYERLFAIVENGERNRLSFSASMNPTDWSVSLGSGGYIDMLDERGPLNKVISFNDYVYVFRDFGVSRVSAYGDQTEFSVSNMFVSSAKIYGNSVCVCGDRILFLTRDGLVSFDGYNTTKINLGIENLLKNTTNEKCSSLFYNGKYYLACKLNFNDEENIGCESYSGGYVNNAIIEYDIKTGEFSITRGIDICSMLLLDDGSFCKVVACFNGEYRGSIGQMTHDGKMFGTSLKKCWVSPKSNLGYPTQIKRVKEVLIKSKTDCDIKISSEKLSKIYHVKGSNTTNRVRTNVFGEQLQISFVSNSSNTDISCPHIVIGVTS